MIIALKKGNGFLVGSSICVSSFGMTDRDLSLPENIPFFKVNGTKDCYVGTCYFSRSSDLIRYNDYIFKDVTNGESIIKNVLPKLKAFLQENGQVKNNNWDNSLIIIKGDKIYVINRFFTVEEKEFAVLGSYVFLGGVYQAQEDGLDAETAIKQTVKMAECIDNRKYFPVILTDTTTNKRKVIYK